jgi:Lamin Tail Domain/CotH kinase protein
VDMHLFNQLGIPAPRSHWSHFRTVMQTAEQADKWHGDFWGLMWVHEDYDKRFLKAHDLKKGNLYKLTRDAVSGIEQFRYQSTFGPTDGSDHDEIYNNLSGTSAPAYITGRVNLDLWCRYHAFAEAIRHYDYWPSGDNNGGWYFYPNYNAANGNKGVMWYLPSDVDATWGPTWNNGHDIVHDALFNDSASGGDTATNPTLWPNYFNQVHEIRTLLWQPGQLNALIDEFAAVIRPIVNAEFTRWHPANGAPADAGNFAGLFGPGNSTLNPVGQTALDLYVAGMKDFAFDQNGGGSSWPGGNIGVGGNAAYLDTLGSSLGENATLYPATPAITFSGSGAFPVNDLRFTTSSFSDPQGSGTFASIQWRIAEVNTSDVWVAGVKRLLEINASHDSGELATFASQYKFPATACAPGKRYRARVRMKDNTGRWSTWSAATEFTAGTFDPSVYASQLVISELMYHATNPTNAERAIAAALVPAQTWDDDSFDYIELRNVSASAVDLTGFQFTAGVTFAFPSGTMIAPGANLLIVQNVDAFSTRYGTGKPIAGAWSPGSKLSNGGEAIALQFGLVTPAVFTFSYNDNPALNWPTAPDGFGASLVRIAPGDTTRNASLGINWRSSIATGGSPGSDDRQSFTVWLATNSETGELTDTDGDGLGNLLEYALGGNPTINSQTQLPTAGRQTISASNYMTLTFRRANIADDLTQTVEFSTDLATWTIPALQVTNTDNGDGTRTEVWRSSTTTDSTLRLFGRVRFTSP